MRKLVVALMLAWFAGAPVAAFAATDNNQSDTNSNGGQGEGQCHKKKDTPTS